MTVATKGYTAAVLQEMKALNDLGFIGGAVVDFGDWIAQWNNAFDGNTVEPTSAQYFKAAQVLAERGWCRNTLVDHLGQRCTIGALLDVVRAETPTARVDTTAVARAYRRAGVFGDETPAAEHWNDNCASGRAEAIAALERVGAMLAAEEAAARVDEPQEDDEGDDIDTEPADDEDAAAVLRAAAAIVDAAAADSGPWTTRTRPDAPWVAWSSGRQIPAALRPNQAPPIPAEPIST